MLLPSLISLRRPPDTPLSPEDIFGSSLGGIFADDLQILHGDDRSTVIVYQPSNPRYPAIELRTADVKGEEQRRKFAHYLWNAGILMAELVGGRPANNEAVGRDSGVGVDMQREIEEERCWKTGEWWTDEAEEEKWKVEGERVLELGAGVGLGGILSTLARAEEVAVTDYPALPILDTITTNVSKNLDSSLRSKTTVHGHTWGDFTSDFASTHAKHYTRILAADCLWMPYEHENLARSMLHFLSEAPTARVYVIAGFHTGRAKVAPFFEETVPEVGLEVEEIYEMNAEGKRRAWAKERDGGRENFEDRKKWLIVARLRRRHAQ